MPESRFTAACVQMRSGRDPVANRDAAVAGVREAAARGAAYVQTPEMTSLVERSRERLFAHVTTEEEDQTLAALREAASDRDTRPDRLDRGQVRRQDRQPRLPDRRRRRDPGVVRQAASLRRRPAERRALAGIGDLFRGACAVLAETPWATLGLTICYDIRFPALYRALAEAGADVLTAPACFTRQTGEAHWHVLQRARAIETGAFVISAAQGGQHEDGRETYGHSLIVDPWGRVLADAGGAEPGIILAEIDLAQVAEARARIPALQHARPFTVDRVGPRVQAAQ